MSSAGERMLSCIQASHGVSQRTIGMRRLRRSLRHLGSRRASVQRSACVTCNCTLAAHTVVVVSVSRIEPLLLLRRRLRSSILQVGCHTRGRIMLGTHGSSRQEDVSGQAGRSWPAGGGGFAAHACCEAVRSRTFGDEQGYWVSAWWLPGENDGNQVYKHDGP